MSAIDDAHNGYPIDPEEPDAASVHGKPPPSAEDFARQIKETADKLLRDGATRGDIKLLSTALKELRYCLKVFSAYRDRRKVTVFGSARLQTDHPAYKAAETFGRRMAEEGFMVITGAASGIMEAGHIGAGRADSIGINIMLPFEQAANAVIANDPKLMHLKYFFTRKLLFVKETDAVVLFPGGFGTLDEGFEALTLVQTGKSHMFPIVMVNEPGGDYWRQLLSFIEGVLVKRGFISPADQALYRMTDSVEQAVREVTGFYRVYHSMRYVKDRLVLRLKRPISEETLEEIRRDFADIVVRGTFELVKAHPFEANEENLQELPRLRFHFDRHHLGRLRMLIDRINADQFQPTTNE
jgi:uncharacterized protein (TIGR00730 family)